MHVRASKVRCMRQSYACVCLKSQVHSPVRALALGACTTICRFFIIFLVHARTRHARAHSALTVHMCLCVQAMGIGSMHVHDLHVTEGTATGGTRASSGAAATESAPAGAGGSGAAAASTGSGRAAPGEDNARTGAGGSGAAAVAAPPSSANRPNAWASRDAAAAGRGGGAEAGAGSSGRPAPSAASVLAAAPPKLVFYLGDQPLPPSATVFQAIQQQASSSSLGAGGGAEKTGLDAEEEAEEEALAALSGQARTGGPAGAGRRLWDGTHTLHYRTATPADAAAFAAVRGGEPCGEEVRKERGRGH